MASLPFIPQIKKLVPELQSVALAVPLKAIGGFFRWWDDRNAPAEVRHNTVKRETLLLGLTAISTVAIQALVTKRLPEKLLKGKAEIAIQTLTAGAGIVFAEVSSRAIFPKPGWGGDRLELQSRRPSDEPHWKDEDDDDKEGIHHLALNNAPTFAQTFSGTLPGAPVINTYNRVSTPYLRYSSPVMGGPVLGRTF